MPADLWIVSGGATLMCVGAEVYALFFRHPKKVVAPLDYGSAYTPPRGLRVPLGLNRDAFARELLRNLHAKLDESSKPSPQFLAEVKIQAQFDFAMQFHVHIESDMTLGQLFDKLYDQYQRYRSK